MDVAKYGERTLHLERLGVASGSTGHAQIETEEGTGHSQGSAGDGEDLPDPNFPVPQSRAALRHPHLSEDTEKIPPLSPPPPP